jgi:hypothetical protein
VVAAEHDRHPSRLRGVRDVGGDAAADLLDRPEVAAVLAALVGRLGHRCAHVAPVVDLAAERAQARLQIGVPDRGRAHVDAAPAGAEVEAGADDGDMGARIRTVHGEEATGR